jgi:CubicO group peptidase (beta-lactamase class C family)
MAVANALSAGVHMSTNRRLLVGGVIALAIAVARVSVSVSGQTVAGADAKVDAVFAKWTAATPGCAVGVATGGKPVLTKGYGMADLEHDVPITPDTIFEAGSVSKQFTAAAVLQLARDGKLSLDDPVRQYVPELPDFGAPLLIRHMLNHTSGLRDWGSITGIAGWPRTTRVHTHAHVLEIVGHQKALNFMPGTRWSYSNTGYNLAAIIVSRVSGKSFPEFTRERLFAPLGMTHTSWRDDYTRIVKGRAIAYAQRGTEFKTNMPFENVYGNGGLLTTVGDLLKWNEHFDAPAAADAESVLQQQTAGMFSDGRKLGYALGLFINQYRGLLEIDHAGTTAGYSAFLTRFPDERVSVAVLCNVATSATELAHQTSDLYLAGHLKSAPAPVRTLTNRGNEGMYRSSVTGAAITLALDKDDPAQRAWTFDGHGGAKAEDELGTVEEYERVTPAKQTVQELQEYAGTYVSDEAEVEIRAVVEDGALVLKRRPDSSIGLSPTYKDGFTAQSYGTIVFRRGTGGRIEGLSISQDRVWDLRFRRTQRI